MSTKESYSMHAFTKWPLLSKLFFIAAIIAPPAFFLLLHAWSNSVAQFFIGREDFDWLSGTQRVFFSPPVIPAVLVGFMFSSWIVVRTRRCTSNAGVMWAIGALGCLAIWAVAWFNVCYEIYCSYSILRTGP